VRGVKVYDESHTEIFALARLLSVEEGRRVSAAEVVKRVLAEGRFLARQVVEG